MPEEMKVYQIRKSGQHCVYIQASSRDVGLARCGCRESYWVIPEFDMKNFMEDCKKEQPVLVDEKIIAPIFQEIDQTLYKEDEEAKRISSNSLVDLLRILIPSN